MYKSPTNCWAGGHCLGFYISVWLKVIEELACVKMFLTRKSAPSQVKWMRVLLLHGKNRVNLECNGFIIRCLMTCNNQLIIER